LPGQSLPELPGVNSIPVISLIIFNLILGVLLRGTLFTAEQKQIIGILIILSTGAVLSYFLIFNMDSARWFGQDKLPIPGNMKRSFFLILAAVCIFIAIISFPSWIVDFVQTLLFGIFMLISALLRFLAPGGQTDELPEELPIMNGLPFFDGETPAEDLTSLNPIVTWIVVGVFIFALAALLILTISLIIKLILRLLRTRRNYTAVINDVYTETIEKITRKNKRGNLRKYTGNPRYSSLKTNRERIIYIYNAYVKRAKRNGLTLNGHNDTANEILEEITNNIKDNKFPYPENLNIAFNTVKYGKDDMTTIDAGELKRKLI